MANKGSGIKKNTCKKKAAGRPKSSNNAKVAKPKKSAKQKDSVKKNTISKIDNNQIKTPILVLSIMGLLAAVVLMSNKFISLDDTNSSVVNKSEKDPTAKIFEFKKEDIPKDKSQKNISGNKKPNTIEWNKEAVNDSAKNADRDLKPQNRKSKINIYFVKFNNTTEKMYLSETKREVNSDSPLKDSLNELIKGPSGGERKNGMLSAIPKGLKIRDVRVQGRNAVIDFNEAIEESADGNILLTRIDQIVYTATQFDDIDSVIIKINGKRKDFIGGEGLSISGPIKRGK